MKPEPAVLTAMAVFAAALGLTVRAQGTEAPTLPGANGPRVEHVGVAPRELEIVDAFVYETPEQAAAGAVRPTRFASGVTKLTLDIRVRELRRLGTTIKFEILSSQGAIEMSEGLFSVAKLAGENVDSMQLDLIPRHPPFANGPYQLKLSMDDVLVVVLNWSVGP
jgi:hypothetical protein